MATKKPKTPPGGTPPGQRPPPDGGEKAMLSLVKAPGVEAEIRRVGDILENQKPPDGGDDELVAAIETLAMSIRDNSSVVQGNTTAIEAQTKAIGTQTVATERLTTSVDGLSAAINRIADILTTPPAAGRATHVTISSVQVEPPARQGGGSMAFETVTHPPVTCIPIDCRADQGEGFNVTCEFNGTIDDEGTTIFPIDGMTGEVTMDPKEEVKNEDGSGSGRWAIKLHVRPPDPNNPNIFNNTVGISVNATVDNPDTPDVEKFVQVFQDVARWIPPTEAKATRVTLNASVEQF